MSIPFARGAHGLDDGSVQGADGRVEELRRLDGSVTGDGKVAITLISGAPGVGKTAVAVRWARRVSDRYPDGQLYVNLRGFDPSGQPVPPDTAIRGLLTALGVRFLDEAGSPVAPGGGGLAHICSVDDSAIHPRARQVSWQIAVDVDNPVCGPRGAAARVRDGDRDTRVANLQRANAMLDDEVLRLAAGLPRRAGRRLQELGRGLYQHQRRRHATPVGDAASGDQRQR